MGEYNDFDLKVSVAEGGGFKVVLTYAGQTKPAFECALPPSFEDLLDDASTMGVDAGVVRGGARRWRGGAKPLADEDIAYRAGTLNMVTHIGERLRLTLLPDPYGETLASAYSEAVRDHQRVRLRLNLAEVPALMRVPWEALYSNDNDLDLHLGVTPEITVQRLLRAPQGRPRVLVEPPVRLLLVTANPRGDLNADDELAKVRQALAEASSTGTSHPFQERVLERISLARLRTEIKAFKPHVLHYIGHGSFEAGVGQLHLHRDDDSSLVRDVDGKALRNAIGGENMPRLVVLNTCEGGAASSADVYGGVAQELIRHGAQFVVAMQYPITDESARIFSRTFYRELFAGSAIDLAVNAARMDIRLADDEDLSVEYITPVLYSAGDEDRFVAAAPADTAAAASSPVPAAPVIVAAATPSLPANPPQAAPAPAPSTKRGLSRGLLLGGVIGLLAALGAAAAVFLQGGLWSSEPSINKPMDVELRLPPPDSPPLVQSDPRRDPASIGADGPTAALERPDDGFPYAAAPGEAGDPTIVDGGGPTPPSQPPAPPSQPPSIAPPATGEPIDREPGQSPTPPTPPDPAPPAPPVGAFPPPPIDDLDAGIDLGNPPSGIEPGDVEYGAPPPSPPPPPPPSPPPPYAPAPQAREFVVYLPFDKATLTSEAQAVIEEAAAYASLGATGVTVVGHADTRGRRAYNVRLSERRAAAVADGLVGLGVPQSVVALDWRGEVEPAVSTGDGVAEPLNRRVTIALTF